jgi:predicted ATPase
VEKLKTDAQVSDNVVDVITATLHRLPEATEVALKVASCLGKVMPLDVLYEYFDGFFDEKMLGQTCCPALRKIQTIGLQNVLDCAVQRGILIRPEGTPTYMWSHDKLQHVSYSLIPESMRPSLHMRLGKLLWKMSAANPDEEWMVFMAADQLNRFSNHTSSPSLGRETARLNLEAAKLSLSKSALFPAMEML